MEGAAEMGMMKKHAWLRGEPAVLQSCQAENSSINVAANQQPHPPSPIPSAFPRPQSNPPVSGAVRQGLQAQGSGQKAVHHHHVY